MIRALVVILGLALGLGAAAVVQGRMAHLRALAPLPDWTAAIRAEAGVLRGRAEGPGGYGLAWRLDGLGAQGPEWAVRIDGPGTGVTLRATLAGDGLRLDGAQGAAALAGAGSALVTAGAGRVTAQGLTLDLRGQGTGLSVAGTALPDGPVALALEPGGWRLTAGQTTVTGAALAELADP